tara:strand:- start:517 stop:1173 length:657 start_codon:yes stop_codon:yes gene_type:complete
MLAPMMNPYLPRPPKGNSGVIVIVSIIFVLFLIGSGVAIWYVTSTTPSPTSGNGGGKGGDSPPGPPKPPIPGGPLNLCTESDPTKCCGSSDHCQSSESACQCPVGKTYDCTSKSCVDSCTCQNGIAMKGKECGNVPYGTEKCKFCNKGYGGSEKGCYKYTCNTSKGTKWQTDCPEGWSCCHVSATSEHKCCESPCAHSASTCRTGDPVKPEDSPGWQR